MNKHSLWCTQYCHCCQKGHGAVSSVKSLEVLPPVGREDCVDEVEQCVHEGKDLKDRVAR